MCHEVALIMASNNTMRLCAFSTALKLLTLVAIDVLENVNLKVPKPKIYQCFDTMSNVSSDKMFYKTFGRWLIMWF